MQRLFGGGRRSNRPQPTSPKDAAEGISARIAELDNSILQCQKEIEAFKQSITSGNVTKRMEEEAQRKVATALKRKKILTQNRELLTAQQLNLEEAQFAADQVNTNIATAEAIKQLNKQMKDKLNGIDPLEIEDSFMKLDDTFYRHRELSEIIGRYSEPLDSLSDDELELEFASIVQAKQQESPSAAKSKEKYILDALKNAPPTSPGKLLSKGC